MIWEIEGLQVGHWTDDVARTGCTVVLCDPPAIASGEVRGSAPATREFALLDPMASVQRIDAVVLSGGSAFGLAAGSGVAEWCEAQNRGFPTEFGRVPIVVGMSLFDLGVGDPAVRPDAVSGRAACDDAPSTAMGLVGASTGATFAKWRGPDATLPAGLVGATAHSGELEVAALVAVNPWGDVVGAPGSDQPPPDLGGDLWDAEHPPVANTTIGVVATNARLDKVGCQQLVRAAHDGLARAITPPHASVDGDAFVGLATGAVTAPGDLVRLLAMDVVDRAIRSLGSAR